MIQTMEVTRIHLFLSVNSLLYGKGSVSGDVTDYDGAFKKSAYNLVVGTSYHDQIKKIV